MEQNNVTAKVQIGILLPGLDGGGEVTSCLRESSYTLAEISRSGEAEPSMLRNCECTGPFMGLPGFREITLDVSDEKRTDAETNPPMIFICPANFDLSAVEVEELGKNTSPLSYPLDLRILLLQIKVLLERQKTNREIRHRLKEREDVHWSISEVFFSVDHEFRHTFFNERPRNSEASPIRRSSARIAGQAGTRSLTRL